MDKENISLQNIDTEKNNNPFEEIVTIVENAKERAYRKVNEELILMYQEVGKYISEKTNEASYGSGFVDNVAEFFSTNYPELKGFNHRGLYRMKQFYELYKDDEKVSPLVTQLSWTNHLKIMSASKSQEERRFYIELAVKERYSKRELERQMDSGYYERYMLSNGNNLPAIQRAKQETHNLFMDSYVLEFLDAPKIGNERDSKGRLYIDFESALPYYKQYGIIVGDSEEIKEFNDIMDFLYLGRRAKLDDFIKLKESYVALNAIIEYNNIDESI